ncbi:MAG: flagellar protein FliS [Fimbriiglobus sp.]|jgi:flagellar biosynthetic protein FliS|nr:flagellar protein FliS [Fimbriiglobus sp.]
MNAYARYAAPAAAPHAGTSRIDLLLALYDGALTRLTKAEMALTNGDVPVATPYMAKAQLIVAELASGVRPDIAPEMATNVLRLYEYVVNELRTPRLENVRNAKKILTTLREGFEAVREEANRLEKSGELLAAERVQMVLEMA